MTHALRPAGPESGEVDVIPRSDSNEDYSNNVFFFCLFLNQTS